MQLIYVFLIVTKNNFVRGNWFTVFASGPCEGSHRLCLQSSDPVSDLVTRLMKCLVKKYKQNLTQEKKTDNKWA